MTVREAIARVGARLQAAGLSEPLREAQALIAACLGWERARLIAHPDARLSARQVQRLECWARRRAAREPLAYLTRRAWFYGLALTVGRGALIPRPETELLVEVFLGWAKEKPLTPSPSPTGWARGGNALTPSPSPTGWARGGNALTPSPSPTGWARGGNALTPSPSPTGWERGAEFSLSRLAGEGDQGGEGSNFPILVDAGTGTGAVALACLTHAPHWLGVGIDRSRRALRLAQANRRTLGLQSRLMLVQGDWLRGLGRGVVDAVLSNPPYVLPDEWDALQPEITRYEPTGALLVPADDPLRRYRRIAQGAHRSLRLGGLLAFETSPRLAPLLAEQLPVWGFPSPHIVCDYAGDARVVWAVRG